MSRKTSRASRIIPTVALVVLMVGAMRLSITHRPVDLLLSLIFGINSNRVSAESAKNLQYLQPDMVRLDGFPWDIIEAKKGRYDYTASDRAMQWARGAKQQVLGILQYAPAWANGQTFTTPRDLGISNCGIPDLENSDTRFNALRTYPPTNNRDFAAYAGAIAKRYPDVRYWQIWNEPNNPIFWPTGPDATAYTRMLSAAYSAIKKANPRAQVVLGGISLNDLKYVRGLYASGAKKYFDIMAVHLYNPRQAPNAYLANELERLHATMTAHGDGKKEIWLTEIGWYTGTAPYAVSEQQQSRYLEQTLAIARSTSSVGAVFWNTLTDCTTSYDTINPEHNYGLFRSDQVAKPAANVMRGMMLNR